MSSAPSPRGKPAAATDVDSIMPLLFATIGNPSISFKKMAAMDPENRTESSLEHKFRKWRQKGREIAEKNPEHAGSFGADTPKKSRGSTAKSGGNGKAGKKQNPEVTDDEPNNDEDWLAAVKCEEGDDVAVNGTKKRAAGGIIEDGASPAKKARVQKKGTAKVQKKPAAKPRESMESASDESEEWVEKASPAKGRAKAGKKTPVETDGADDLVPLKIEQEA